MSMEGGKTYGAAFACRRLIRGRLRTKMKTLPLLEQDLQLADLCRELEKTECMLDALATGDARERLCVVKQLHAGYNAASKERAHAR